MPSESLLMLKEVIWFKTFLGQDYKLTGPLVMS